ncbi:hypothetical protein FRACYDRAFT_245817 [Fragilariopsis cylindrus CCMP1102]|uniref:Alpha/beta-hydrolase n=1 Tax=Fragilariopsis cylindrus CCMP1102 TaxID=635003 RepID=A0A1E7EZT7_9STRA|nr:hypothetical protein FRACYDRAFT_245817 [Fragilariopsis cylindrus CCMP1102]|eukprot:OEU11377.1 hypothetical protein FRACYDRAFT_245817 [Fragilariopsis cylindrus CCMP1102]
MSDNNRRRKLIDVTPCDTTLVTISQDAISVEFENIIDMIGAGLGLTPIAIFGVKFLFANKKNFGVEIRKVCASCKEIRENDNQYIIDNPDSFNKYCGEDAYGANDIQSGLVTYPLVSDSNSGISIIKSGVSPSYIHSRPTTYEINKVPSGSPGNVLESVDVIFDLVASMTLGYIGFAPDFLGYGSSESQRYGYLVRNSYVTATLPIYLKAKYQLAQETDCNTDIADVAFYSGYSEGGYASIALAEGLNEILGIKPLRVLAGGGPYKLSTEQFYQIFLGDDESTFINENKGREFFPLLLGAAYSSTNTELANFNTDQDLLVSSFRSDALEWLSDTEKTEKQTNEFILKKLDDGDGFSNIWNDDILTLFRKAAAEKEKDFCNPNYKFNIDGKTDKFCEAIKQNDLLETILNVDYPIEFCHSINDEIVFYEHVPNTTELSSNPNLKLLTTLDSLHTDAGITCLTDEVLFIAGGVITSLIPQSIIDANTNLINTINNGNGGCTINSPTTSPTNIPTETEPSSSPTIITVPPVFLNKKNGNVKKCSSISKLSIKRQKQVCTSKRFQIRSKKGTRLAPASVACSEVCNQYCVKEFNKNEFLLKTKNKGKKEVTKKCKWLKKQSQEDKAKICSNTIQFKGGIPIYGQASEVCTKTCDSC